MSERRMTRLKLLQAGAAGVAGAAATGLVAGEAEAREAVAPPTALKFLTRWEFDLVTAMAETIWPTDDLGPGARVAGVGYYIDGQLSGSWGQGHRFYLTGPFYTATDSGHGWQIPLTPAEVYRAFLPAYDTYVRQAYGKQYVSLDPATQAKALDDLRLGRASTPLSGSTAFGSADFYSLFRQNVLEGMLADPAYGGNRGMVGWRWVGFPGDPMRRNDEYHKWIFTDKRYPYEDKPLPMEAPPIGAGKPGAHAHPAKPMKGM